VCNLLSYIVENESRREKIGHLQLTMISILRAISQAVEFIRSYADRNALGRYSLLLSNHNLPTIRAGRLWGAQWRGSKLKDFKDTFSKLKDDFEKSRNFQTYFDIYQIRENFANLLECEQLALGKTIQQG
jgi:hypothetical protein